MAKQEKNSSCCGDICCKVESMVSIDERGQMILPKDFRKKANIKRGDKLILVSWEDKGKVCCMSLIKADAFSDVVKGVLGPLMQQTMNSGENK